ncbi:23S rRNA pseudouridine(1911/1915/1917) synthase [Gammaproteobacteria bacterium]
MKEIPHLHARIPIALAGQRLDQALAILFPDYSRGRFQTWIRAEAVRLDGEIPRRPRDRVHGGEIVDVAVEEFSTDLLSWTPEPLPLTVVYADNALLVVNKPAGLVVHPAAGNRQGTLVNALLHHAPELMTLPRAGLIHRLDKDTTGLLVVARTLVAHHSLVEQLKARELLREYDAVVNGVVVAGGKVEAPLGRHPQDRKRIAVVGNGRPAVTHYRVIHRFPAHTHLRLRLETGRTHQIRVHMNHLHYPLLGDPVYGGRTRLPPGCSSALAAAIQGFGRQALHATRLGFIHPLTGEVLSWEAPFPADMAMLLTLLEKARTGIY